MLQAGRVEKVSEDSDDEEEEEEDEVILDAVVVREELRDAGPREQVSDLGLGQDAAKPRLPRGPGPPPPVSGPPHRAHRCWPSS